MPCDLARLPRFDIETRLNVGQLAGRVLELELMFAECDNGSGTDDRSPNLLTVHFCAVGAPKVGYHPTVS